MKNPLFDEQLRAGFVNVYMMKLHLTGLVGITGIVYLFYPSQEFSYFLTKTAKPEVFNVAIYTIAIFLSYLTIKSAVFSIENTKERSMKEWFLYTGISVKIYLSGRLSYGFFYSFFLTLLFMPILLVAASITAIGPGNILAILLIMYLYIVNLYMLGFLFYTFFKKQHWILTLILWFSIILILFLSPILFTENHPVLLLVKLQISTDIIKDLKPALIFSLSSLLLLVLSSSISVYLYSRRIHE